MSGQRYVLQNLGAMGRYGESTFSTLGIRYANMLIEQGWIPCGMCISKDNEVIQTFYLPMELEISEESQ
jgi:hypothetical protein